MFHQIKRLATPDHHKILCNATDAFQLNVKIYALHQQAPWWALIPGDSTCISSDDCRYTSPKPCHHLIISWC